MRRHFRSRAAETRSILGACQKLACRCGYIHNLSPIPDDGFQVLPDWATDRLLYTMETKPEDWEISDLRRTALSRLYLCPNCEAVIARWQTSEPSGV